MAVNVVKPNKINRKVLSIGCFALFLFLLAICFTTNLNYLRQKIISSFFLYRGNTVYQHKEYDDAEVNYRKALLTEPVLWKAQYNLGNSYYKQQRYQDAIQVYKRILAIRHDKTDAGVWNNLGTAYFMARKLDLSINAFKIALLFGKGDNVTRENYLFVSNEMLKQQEQEPVKKVDKNKKEDDKNAQNDKRSNPAAKGDDPHDNKLSKNDQLSDKDISDLMKKIIQNEDAVRARITNKKLKGETTFSDGKDY